MKKTLLGLTAAAACGVLLWLDGSANAQAPAAPAAAPAPAAASQPARPRIALVNIAKVLREFNKANADGSGITKKRQEYVDTARPLSEKLAAISRQIQNSQVPAEKEKLQKEAIALNRQLEDLQEQAKRVLGDLTDHTIVEVYQNIKAVINDIAVTNNLDLVMCFPDASNAEDDKKPAVAQLKLQSPALIPFYHRGMDITDVVIVTLNRRHPAPPSAGLSAAPTPAPMGGTITPVGGKQ